MQGDLPCEAVKRTTETTKAAQQVYAYRVSPPTTAPPLIGYSRTLLPIIISLDVFAVEVRIRKCEEREFRGRRWTFHARSLGRSFRSEHTQPRFTSKARLARNNKHTITCRDCQHGGGFEQAGMGRGARQVDRDRSCHAQTASPRSACTKLQYQSTRNVTTAA